MSHTPLVIIPTFNESLNIKDLVEEVLQVLPKAHLVVIDDSSPDGTSQLVEKLLSKDKRIHLITRKGKRGLGPAILEGYRFALEHDYSHIIEMDADFSHPPKLLPELISSCEDVDLVLASRYIEGGGVSDWIFYRVWLSRFANFIARAKLKIPCQDLTGGYRCFNASSLRSLEGQLKNIKSTGFVFVIEMNYLAFRNNLSMKEIPFVFPGRKKGKSKISVKILFEALFQVLRL